MSIAMRLKVNTAAVETSALSMLSCNPFFASQWFQE